MNLLHVEAVDTLRPLMPELDTPMSFEEIAKSLNQDLVNQLQTGAVQNNVLEEFVFALDHLHEMGGLPNFPNNRLINTPDIVAGGHPVVCAFNDLARRTHDASQFGVAVGPQVMTSVKEFFDFNYLQYIALVFQSLRVHALDFQFDKVSTQLNLNRFTAHPEFGVLTYRNLRDEVTMMIPFHLTRIVDVH